jgi:hypothetical protein
MYIDILFPPIHLISLTLNVAELYNEKKQNNEKIYLSLIQHKEKPSEKA